MPVEPRPLLPPLTSLPPPRLRWPLPAVLAWAAGWTVALLTTRAGVELVWSFALGSAVAAALALLNVEPWRRALAALGFPLSALALMELAGRFSASAWLAALVPLALIYPMRAWRDAPFFPTPPAALRDLPRVIDTSPRRILDAGCGLGHGLAALQRLWPAARLHGVEWSAPMAWLASRRVPGAVVTRADMWALDWSDFDLVYLFQRPESMDRAWHKAQAEMTSGAWLVSLEFEVPGARAASTVDAGNGRAVHIYRIGAVSESSEPRPRSTGAVPGR